MILFIATCVISGLFALKAASFRNYRTYSADITTAVIILENILSFFLYKIYFYNFKTFASVLHIVYMVCIVFWFYLKFSLISLLILSG
jgi:hypothetical protein